MRGSAAAANTSAGEVSQAYTKRTQKRKEGQNRLSKQAGTHTLTHTQICSTLNLVECEQIAVRTCECVQTTNQPPNHLNTHPPPHKYAHTFWRSMCFKVKFTCRTLPDKTLTSNLKPTAFYTEKKTQRVEV